MLVDLEKMKHAIVSEYVDTPEIRECLLYAIEGGKNIRAQIGLHVTDLLLKATPLENNYIVASLLYRCCCFVELIHIASLILDDCPYMDNDIVRRGKPSVHQKYGVAMAQLASFILIEVAHSTIYDILSTFRNMPIVPGSECHLLENSNYLLLSEDLYRLRVEMLGEKGLAGGQLYDLYFLKDKQSSSGSHPKINLCAKNEAFQKYLKMIEYKTCRLFEASFVIPAMIIKTLLKSVDNDCGIWSNKIDIALYKELGYQYGMAFQLSDDLIDQNSDQNGNNATNYLSESQTINLVYETLEKFRKESKRVGFNAEKFIRLARLEIY